MIDWQRLSDDHPVLAGVPASLREQAVDRRVVAGERLARQGEAPAAMFFVLAGEVRLLRRSPAGRETIMQRVQGGFVAEASLDATCYHCDLVAGVAGRVLAFPRRAFDAVLAEDARFNRAWIAHLSRELRQARARNERLACPTAAERIRHAIMTEGDGGGLILDQPRKEWAAELGLTHEALYRALRRLRDAGAIREDGLRIEWLAD
ncbi:MAG: Crp/Fnr family transcriptional regulator [Guyparkeria sp.]